MPRPKLAVLQEHTAELILGIIAVGSGLLIPALEEQFDSTGLAVAAVGVQITAAIYLLKYEFFSRLSNLLDERLELYNAIGKIATLDQRTDSLVMKRANEAVERCRQTLGELMIGRVRDSADTIFHLISNEIEAASSSIRAVHVGHTVDHIARWSEGHMKNYYRKNVALVGKVKVQRIFVLYRDKIINSETGKIHTSVLKVLRQQDRDKINVFVAWDGEVKEKSYIEDLVIVDERVVEYGVDAGGFVSSDWPDRDAFLNFDRRRVQEFVSQFDRLKSFAFPLAEWLEGEQGSNTGRSCSRRNYGQYRERSRRVSRMTKTRLTAGVFP